MSHRIAVIPGDGIGQEVVPAAVRILESLPLSLSFEYGEAGDHVAEAGGEPLPAETRSIVEGADATLFGAAGETAADVIIPLRRAVDAYANVRPAKTYPGVDAVHPETDLVFVRENTEGVYAGIEAEIADGVTTLTRVITERASERIAAYAFELATDRGAEAVTIAHKANVMRVTDGLFLETAERVGSRYDVGVETAIMDALAMHLVRWPTEYDVIVCPNLAGDVLSDLAAGLVGGLGLLPSANVGSEKGVFEPVHGSAPDIAGEGIANPIATILSAGMMLEHLGHQATGERIEEAVTRVLETGPHTPDLDGEASTEDVTEAIIALL